MDDFLLNRPMAEPKRFEFLQGLYKNSAQDEPDSLWQTFLMNTLRKPYVTFEGKTWFQFGKSWTYCEAREPENGRLRKIGKYVYYYRAVF